MTGELDDGQRALAKGPDGISLCCGASAGRGDAFVRSNCGTDEQLASEVLAMLQHDSRGNGLLDQNLAETAQKTFPAPDPLVRTDFGPYKIIRLLVEGGMGVV